MRITDFFLVIPTFVLALILAPVITSLFGTEGEILGIRITLFVIVIVIGLTSWSSTARIIRSQTLSLKERAFVDRARVIGSSSRQMMLRHVLPNVTDLIVANTVLVFAGAVLTETTLSFIGLGDPFAPSWGEILDSAQEAGAPGSRRVVVSRSAGRLHRPRRPRLHARRQRPRRDPQPAPEGPAMSGPADPRRLVDAVEEADRALVDEDLITENDGSARTVDPVAILRGPAPDGPTAGAGRQRPLPKLADPTAPLLVVEDLKTYFDLEQGQVKAVDGVSFTPARRRGAGDRRRIGLRQDDDRAVARPAAAVERPDRRGQHQACSGSTSRPSRRTPCGAIDGARSRSSSRAR